MECKFGPDAWLMQLAYANLSDLQKSHLWVTPGQEFPFLLPICGTALRAFYPDLIFNGTL